MYRLAAPRSPAAWAGRCSAAGGRLLLASPSSGGCWHSPRQAHKGLCSLNEGGTRGWPAQYPRLLQLPACRLSTVRGSSGPEKEPSEECREQTPDAVEDENKLTRTQQLKKVFTEYGVVGVVFHVGMSLTSLGVFYMIVSSGIDITAVLLWFGFGEAVVQSKMAAGTSTFVLAYAIHKLFSPVRISITVMSVPFIVRYFRKIGFFKSPTPRS